jgi:hypothetical protein
LRSAWLCPEEPPEEPDVPAEEPDVPPEPGASAEAEGLEPRVALAPPELGVGAVLAMLERRPEPGVVDADAPPPPGDPPPPVDWVSALCVSRLLPGAGWSLHGAGGPFGPG